MTEQSARDAMQKVWDAPPRPQAILHPNAAKAIQQHDEATENTDD
jgi:hypothetical protein